MRSDEKPQMLAVYLLLTTRPTDRALAGWGPPKHVQEAIVTFAQAGLLLGPPDPVDRVRSVS